MRQYLLFVCVENNQVIETLKAVFIIERLGIYHSKRVELLEFFDSHSVPLYTPEEYFGWNPAAGPPVSDEAGSACMKMANALMGAYFAHFVSVPLGCSFVQVSECVHKRTLYG